MIYEQFINRSPCGRTLVIAGGESTNQILKHKQELKAFFDEIIIVGSCFQDFDDIATVHIITEKDFLHQYVLNKGSYRRDLPRFVNYKSLNKYNPELSLYPITRLQEPNNFDIRNFIFEKEKPPGLVVGKIVDGLSTGTVLLSALHLACILGSSAVYMVGAELQFKGAFDHYGQRDRQYRDKTMSHPNSAKPIKVGEIETTDQFWEAAKAIDYFINGAFSGVQFYSFSGGLLKAPMALDFSKWLQGLEQYNAWQEYVIEEEGAAWDEDDE